MTRQGFKTVDVLRLEVEIEPTGPYNLLPSAAGGYGSWGWLTPVANSTVDGFIVGTSVSYSGPAASYFTSDQMPVKPTWWVAVRWTFPPPVVGSGAYSVRFEWLDQSGAFISFSTASAVVGAAGNYTLTAQQAPANARFARLRVDLNTGVTFVAAAGFCVASDSTAAAINAAIATVPSASGTNWRNVIGPSSNIRVVRETLNLGVLEAEILDSTLDPATTPDLRPGREVRLTTIDGGGVWQTLFVGKADVLEVDYDAKRVPARPPRVKIVATDRTARLAATTRPQGVATIPELPAVVEGAGIPWNVNGVTTHVKNFNVVGVNDKATALDQVALTRDSALGSAWVSRNGVLYVRDYVADPAIANPGAEVNTTGWSAGSNTTLARSTTAPKTGAGNFRLTRTGGTTGNISMNLPLGTSGIPVVGGMMLEAKGSFKGVTVGRSCQMVWGFYDAAGSSVNYDANLYPASLSNIVSTTTGYTESTYRIRVPGGARYATLTTYVLAAAHGEQHEIDDVTISVPLDATLTEPNYSGLDLGFRSTDCVNSVNVEVLAYDPVAGATTPVVFGPYEDAVSIGQWQRRSPSKPYTVHGIAATDAAASAYAAKILARNANPTVTVRGLTLPMRDATDRVNALRDLGDRVRVRHVGKGIDQTLRVARVVHTITAEPAKWLVSLGFDAPTSVASPQVVPPAVPLVAPLVDTAWVDLPLVNSWAHYDPTVYGPARYRRLNGVVHIRGLVVQPVAGQGAFTIATLPAGFRPVRVHLFTTNGDLGAQRMDINPDGTITLPGGPTAARGFVSVAVSFPADQ